MSLTETRTDCSESNVTWTISKFSEFNTTLRSQKSKIAQAKNNVQWNLMLIPYNEDKTHVSLFLEIITANQIYVKCKFTIQDGNKKDIKSLLTSTHVFFEDGYYGYNNLLKRQDILPLQKDTLIIKCWIKINPENNSICLERTSSISNKKFLDNFNNLFNQGTFQDVILKTNDGTTIGAHKCILGAQSPIFAAMFELNKEENEEKKVQTVDMDEDILRPMLEFMYSHKFDANNSKLSQLFVASDKYEIDHLKMMCAAGLSQQLTTENAAKLLILADCHKSLFLKKKILDFMKENIKEIVEKDAMKILESEPSLYSDIIKSLIK